jgi:hypothetical protein
MSVEELFKNGYTIFPSLISEDSCNKLKQYLDQNFNKNLPYNYSKGHYQIHLPNNLNKKNKISLRLNPLCTPPSASAASALPQTGMAACPSACASVLGTVAAATSVQGTATSVQGGAAASSMYETALVG